MPTVSQTRSSKSHSRRVAPAGGGGVIETLKEDHKRAKKAFRDFERLDLQKDPGSCAQIVAQCCAELTVHATLEEELLYPAARKALADDALIDEAEVEHATAKELISQLLQMQPHEEKFAARFTVLGEYIKHHIKEEEVEMFPRLSGAKLDWHAVEARMLARREQLSAELMPTKGPGGDGAARSGRSKALRAPAVGNRAALSRRGPGTSGKD